MKFIDQIRSIQHLYVPEVEADVLAHLDYLIPLERAWSSKLSQMFVLDAARRLLDLSSLEKCTQHATEKFRHTSPKLVWFSGPGAVGKETVRNALEKVIPSSRRVVNTTTRPRRAYESDGQHYNFVTPDEFNIRLRSGRFLSVREVPDRGLYGIERSAIPSELEPGDILTAEEVPSTLKRAVSTGEIIGNRAQIGLVYILPPQPFFPHLAYRYFTRLRNLQPESEAGADILVTLGERQVTEIQEAVELASECQVLFVHNHHPQMTAREIGQRLNLKAISHA